MRSASPRPGTAPATRAAARRIVLALACAGAAGANAQPFGVVTGNADGQLTLHWSSALTADGPPLQVQWPGPDGQWHCCQRIPRRQLSTVGHSALVMQQLDTEPSPVRAYRVSWPSGTARPQGAWVGIAAEEPVAPLTRGPNPAPRQSASGGTNGTLSPGLRSLRQPERRAWLCPVQEGLTLWQRTGPDQPPLRWYIGLGYGLSGDATACCPLTAASASQERP